MWRVVIGMTVGVARAASAAAAEETRSAAKCQVAENNPVTGHVFCISPLGAPVAPPPSDIAPPCEAEASRGQWTWAPTCKDAKEGM
ncbi:MAG: hypothetical protein ACR2GC_11775 [Methyloceanibacter sp.]|uniref:hypothetical protein n=1 Tax=Methyloceanibacter sp. TaxID=1965321 RepID=UPI003D9B744C